MAPVLATFSRSARPALGACCLILWISSRLSNVTRGLYWFSSSSVSVGFVGLA